MGIGYALTTEAREIFNNRFGTAGHWVPPGGMRTFLPGARLGVTEDAFNHRLLAPSTLRDSSENRIRRILRNAQLKRLSALRIPDALREVEMDEALLAAVATCMEDKGFAIPEDASQVADTVGNPDSDGGEQRGVAENCTYAEAERLFPDSPGFVFSY